LVKQRKVRAHAEERNEQILDRTAAAESLSNSLPKNKYVVKYSEGRATKRHSEAKLKKKLMINSKIPVPG
jgi:hypothetical protein